MLEFGSWPNITVPPRSGVKLRPRIYYQSNKLSGGCQGAESKKFLGSRKKLDCEKTDI